jgi:hypothetical protein
MGAGDACGGNAIGNWKYKGACTSVDLFATLKVLCPLATATSPVYNIGGTLDISGSIPVMSFTRALSFTASSNLLIPNSCVPTGCSALSAIILGFIPSGSTATCSSSSAGCSCSVVANYGLAGSGTVTAVGGVASVTMGTSTYDYYYCVNGNQLIYKGVPATSSDNTFCYVLTL